MLSKEIYQIEDAIKEYIPKYLTTEPEKKSILDYIKYVDNKDMLRYKLQNLKQKLNQKQEEHRNLVKSISDYNGW